MGRVGIGLGLLGRVPLLRSRMRRLRNHLYLLVVFYVLRGEKGKGKGRGEYGLTPVQKAVRPSSQLRQRPSATLKGITTRSPFLSRETPDPVSRTMPMFS